MAIGDPKPMAETNRDAAKATAKNSKQSSTKAAPTWNEQCQCAEGSIAIQRLEVRLVADNPRSRTAPAMTRYTAPKLLL